MKLVYNGEPNRYIDTQTGKYVYDCSSTRSNHKGYGTRTTVTLSNSTYWYSTGYKYENNTYILDGTFTSTTWNEPNSENVVGLYTCLNSDKNATCNTLYLIDAYKNDTSAYVFPLNSTTNTNYNLIANSISFNTQANSPAYLGYMYNTVYPTTTVQLSGKTGSIDTSNNYYISNNITHNGNLTFTLNNAIQVNGSDWSTVYSNYKGYYICLSGTTTCNYSNMRYMTDTSSSGYSYWDNNIYGKRITYENGHYIIDTSDASFFQNFMNYTPFNDSWHYTCFNATGVCEEVYYVFASNVYYYMAYLPLTGGKYISTNMNNITNNALYEMLNDPYVNTKSSTIKRVIDAWYAAKLINYTEYIDGEEIYCQERKVVSYGAWDENVTISSSINWIDVDENGQFSCSRKLDSYTLEETDIGNGALTYPIGLVTYGEATLLRPLLASANYYLGTSGGYVSSTRYNYATGWQINGNLGGGNSYSDATGVRPAIALKEETLEFSQGDGSRTNPYVINVGNNIVLNDINYRTNKTKAVEGEIIAITNNKHEVISFKLNGVLTNGNTFIMPNGDVEITEVKVNRNS